MLFDAGTPSGRVFQQPLHSVVDVGPYTDAAIFIHLSYCDFDGEPLDFKILTASENREGRYREVATVTIDNGVTIPYTHMPYLTAAGDSGDFHGFDRYLRIELACGAGETGQMVAFDVRGLMRARA